MTKEELSKFYREHVKKIYSYFYSRTYSVETSEDLTTDVFIRFVDSIKENQNSIEDHIKYLYGITRNVFASYLRNKYQHTDIDIDKLENVIYQEDDLDNDEIVVELETHEDMLVKILHLVPESQRIVVELRLIQKLSLDEICKKLGRDMNYVKKTQQRGIKTLRTLIECTPTLTNIVKEEG